MKILLISSFFPPTHTAGTEKRTLSYAKSLQRQGHEVQVVCAGEWDQGTQYWNGYTDEIYQQIAVRRIHLNWSLAPDPNRFLYCNPMVQDYLGQWLMKWKPDIVHITSCFTLSASVIQAAKDQNLPVVLTLTDFWFICPRVNLLRGDGSLCNGQTTAGECLKCKLWKTKADRLLSSFLPEKTAAAILKQVSRNPSLSRQRGLRGMAFDMEHRKAYLNQMIRSADYVTAPSAVLSEIVNDCTTSNLVKVIHSGHDLTWLNTLKPREKSGPLRIAYIGQIIPIKGIHILLSAFLSAGFTNQAELAIFGDHNKYPNYFQELEVLRKDQDLNIDFHGAFPHEHLGEILSDIDVLVVPSLWHENNPRVIQEAFAAKTPVIASNVEGISEFVQHGVNGLLFERGSIADLAKQLHRIVYEPGLLEQLQSGIPAVKSVNDEISEFIEIYTQLIAGVKPVLPEIFL